MLGMTPFELTIVCLAMGLGGLVKGVAGAGAPVVAVPIIATQVGLPEAVALMVVPNLLANIVQLAQYRATRLRTWFPSVFALAGLVGAGAGTFLLLNASGAFLMLSLAVIVLAYVILRLTRPSFRIPMDVANRLAAPVGLIGGVLQGAVGISAPVSVSFVNAMRLDRATFVPTMSLFFLSMSVSQIPIQAAGGLLTARLAVISCVAMMVQFAGMWIGSRAGRHLSPQVFDRVVLVILVVMAIRMAISALQGG